MSNMKPWDFEYYRLKRLLLLTFFLALMLGFFFGAFWTDYQNNTSYTPLHDNHYVVFGNEFGTEPSCLGCHISGSISTWHNVNGQNVSITYTIQISNLTIGKSYIVATTRDIIFFRFNGTMPHLLDYFFEIPDFNSIEFSLFEYKNNQFFAYNQLGNRDNLLFLDYYKLEW